MLQRSVQRLQAGQELHAAGTPCKVGATVCTSGLEVCGETGNVANGTGCGNGKVCNAGTCGTFTMSVETGDKQTAYINQALTPVVVKLVDANGVAASGVTVQFSAPEGAVALNASATTNVAGGSPTGNFRLGRGTGEQKFTAMASGLMVTITATATEPPAGTIYPLNNLDRTRGSIGVPGPATMANSSVIHGIALAKDGTLYVSDTYNFRVLKISPKGVMSVVAGTGTLGYSGDGGFATEAKLLLPASLVVDDKRSSIYRR